jgi:serine/threonine-protein kinase
MARHRRRRRRIKRFFASLLVLALVAAAAWGTWTYAIPHTAVVPQVVGEPAAEATADLVALGFEVEHGQAQYSDVVPDGAVLRIRPGSGTELDVGTVVTIVVSRGPRPVDVPAVEGKERLEAQRLLRDGGFEVGRVRERYDAEVPAGHVISRSPVGARLPKGSAVDLLVSRGPKPIVLPDVRGMAEEQAIAKLDAKGFGAVVEQRFSDEVERGRVIRTDPVGGERVQPTTTIVVTVSLGPRVFACPDFVGMTVEDARALAEQHGLRLNAVEVPGATGNRIVSQQPPAGTNVRYGDTIDAYYA